MHEDCMVCSLPDGHMGTQLGGDWLKTSHVSLWLKTICASKELVTTVIIHKQINSECPLGLEHM